MMLEKIEVNMGKAVAYDILHNKNNFESLKNELEEIQKKSERGEDIGELKDYLNIKKILSITFSKRFSPKIHSGAYKTLSNNEVKRFKKGLIKWFEKQIEAETNEKKLKKLINGLKALSEQNKINKIKHRNYLKMKEEWDLIKEFDFKEVLFYQKPNSKSGTCHICNRRKGWEKKSLSGYKMSNPSNYTEGGQIEFMCNVCNFFVYLANFYPLPQKFLHQWSNGIYYNVFSPAGDILSPILFLGGKSFNRYIKHRAICKSKSNNDFLIFYTLGSQSENNSIIGYGEFNITKSLESMLKKQKIDSVNKFKYIFITGEIPKDTDYISIYIPTFITMIQQDRIPIEMLKLFLKIFRNNVYARGKNNELKINDKYIRIFLSFEMFIRDFYEVRYMTENLNAVNRGFNFGRKIREDLFMEYKDQFESELDRIRRWLIAKTGVMEVSEKEFMKGILEIQRNVRNISVYSKDLEDIAKDERKRIEFLVGMLSGLNVLVKGGETNE